MSIEAMKLALEYLQDNQHHIADNERHVYVMEYNAFIERLEKLIEQAEQAQPVACDAYDKIDRFLRNNLDDTDYAEYSASLDSLYTASPPRQPWVGLTDEDKQTAFDDTQEGGGFWEFADAIEAKLKEKNT